MAREQRHIQADVKDLTDLGERLRRTPKDKREVTAAVALAGALLRIRDREGNESPLLANPAQLAFERNRGRRNIVLKARQMGMTSWVAGRFFLKTITGRGVLSVQVAHTRSAAEGIFRMVQRFWECLPEEFRQGALRRNVANVGAMRFPELDSEFRVLSAADKNAGRGLTMQNLHCSEVSRWPGNAGETMAGLRAALVPGGELVMESTPNGAYGCFHEEWTKAVDPDGLDRGRLDQDGGNGVVVRHFFPWHMEPANRAYPAENLTPEEKELVHTRGLTLEQIGFRRGLEESYRGLRSQEYAEDAETCFRATGDCCFDVEAIEARLKAVEEPRGRRRAGALQVWLPPQPGKQYIVGVDSAGGGGDGDFAAVQVIDAETGLQCAELRQRIGPAELARVAAELAKEYGGALVAVERNNHGAAVIAYLNTQEHYANVYTSGSASEKAAGWNTSAASKPLMVALMGALLSESPGIFSSRRLLGGVPDLRRLRRRDHRGGERSARRLLHGNGGRAVRTAGDLAGPEMTEGRVARGGVVCFWSEVRVWRCWRCRRSGRCGAGRRAS